MAELGARVRKKAYNLEIKRKYQHELHFKVKERPPIERIKDQLRKLFAPKKEEAKAAEPSPSAPPPGGFNFMVFGAFILIALIVIGIGWLYLTTQVLQPGVGVFEPQVERASMANSIEGGEILTTGVLGRPEHIAAVLVDYDTSNLKNYTVEVSTYEDEVPSEVFILNSEKFGATTYGGFIQNLRSNLAKRNIPLNEISIKQLETLPQGAVVIIPSGAIPQEILGIDSSLTMNRLADKGVVVIYIGQPFTRMLNGTLVSFTPREALNTVPVKFEESVPLQSTDGFHLFQPLYRATAGGGWQGLVAYGSVSILKRGNGAFIFLPQTLDGGWRGNYSSAAEDVSRIVFEIPWTEQNGEPAVYEFTNQTDYAGRRYFFSEPFEDAAATAKLDFIGYSAASAYPIRETLLIRVEKMRNNTLFIEQGGKVVSANITLQPVRLNAQLREPRAAQPNMYLQVVDSNNAEVQTFPQGNVNVQADTPFDVMVYLDKGEYIVKLIDDQSVVYAETYMKVVSIDITWTGNDRNKPSVYLFDVTMDGVPRTLAEVSVTIDGGEFGTHTFNNVDKLRIDLSQYRGNEMLPLGEHTFDFTAGALRVEVPVVHTRPPTIFEDPIFWVTLLLTGGIVGIGALFAKQESVFYSIDIPDFPPVARTKIPLSPDTILSVFSKINETYRWQNTPLTPAELKNGFKDIFYKGKPIYITDFNVEYLLAELEKKGSVKEAIGYYGLTEWEKASGRPMDYLALMRRLRDICVNNAIPFTGIGESEEADSVITVVGQQMYLHFYGKGMDAQSVIKRILPTVGNGISIIMFKGPSDKVHFEEMLDSSPTVAPLILKMEADSSSLLYLTADELEKMVLEFKSM